MNLKLEILKGSALLSVGQVISQLSSLVRNILIASIVSPNDFGISSIFILVSTFLEMTSNLSLDRFLIQSSNGDKKRFQETAHFLLAIRGIIIFCILFVSSKLISEIFSIPEIYMSFYLLSFIPLIHGFFHLDARRFERHMNFKPNVIIEATSHILVLLLTWPIANWLGDYRAMLLLLFLRILLLVIGSHFISVRKYRWTIDIKYIKQFFSFGWPLLINGLLIFLILQGDRIAIASAKKIFGVSYTMEDVGYYSIAFMITMIPSIMVVKVLSPVMLSVLSKFSKDDINFNINFNIFSQILMSIGIIFSFILIIFGPFFLSLIFGIKYSSSNQYIPFLALMWMLRMFRSLLSQSAIAKGKTKIIMNSNLIRICYLPLIVLVIAFNKSIVMITFIGFIAESTAYI